MFTIAAAQWTDIITAFATVLVGVGAGAGLLFAGFQLREVREEAKVEARRRRQELAYRYFERLMDPRMVKYINRWMDLATLKDDESADKKYEEWRRSSYKARMTSLVVPNFFEELAGMYLREVADCDVIRSFLADAAVNSFTRGRWLIHRERERLANDRLFDMWERLCVEIQAETAEEARGT
jgi:hypothetical protein